MLLTGLNVVSHFGIPIKIKLTLKVILTVTLVFPECRFVFYFLHRTCQVAHCRGLFYFKRQFDTKQYSPFSFHPVFYKIVEIANNHPEGTSEILD